MEISVYRKIMQKYLLQIFRLYLFSITTVKSLQSSCFFSDFSVRLLLLKCFFLNRCEKVTRKNCGTQTKKLNLARHKKCCSAGTLFYTQCPPFCTKSQNDLKYHFAKKHSAPKLDVTFKCKLCYQWFPRFYALLQHRNTQHGMQIGSRTRDVDVEPIVGDVEDHMLKGELRSYQHFLVDSELERARHKVLNYAVETLNKTIVNKKLDHFFNNLNCAAKWIWLLVSFCENIENGVLRYFHAHENNTLLDGFKLVCTHDDLTKLKAFLNKLTS